jgi:hypothetical protein
LCTASDCKQGEHQGAAFPRSLAGETNGSHGTWLGISDRTGNAKNGKKGGVSIPFAPFASGRRGKQRTTKFT